MRQERGTCRGTVESTGLFCRRPGPGTFVTFQFHLLFGPYFGSPPSSSHGCAARHDTGVGGTVAAAILERRRFAICVIDAPRGAPRRWEQLAEGLYRPE